MVIDGIEFKEGWLTVSRSFNDKIKNDKEVGCDSNLNASVMLSLVIDENLKRMGVAREVVNKVQKLRKEAGLNIDDQVEIFFEMPEGETTFT